MFRNIPILLAMIHMIISISADKFNQNTPERSSSKCEILSLRLKRHKLAMFQIKLRTDKNTIEGLDIFERNVTIKNSDTCDNQVSQFSCPAKKVFKKYPDHFPAHSIEKECLCKKCAFFATTNLIDIGCKPVYELLPVLIHNQKSCKWVESLRPKVIGCQCSFNRDINIF